MNRVLISDIVLLALNVLWGYCFVLIKQLLIEIPPYYLLASRFLVAAICLLPFQISALKKITKKDMLYYSACGLALGLGFSLQTAGMVTTNPGKAGVITGSLVVFVPIIYFVWTRLPLSKSVLLGTIFTFIGLCFISLDGVESFTEINRGDFFLLAGAITYAFHVVIVERTCLAIENVKPMLLALIQLFIVGIFGITLSIGSGKIPTVVSPFAVYGILFLALLGSLMAYVVQMWAQKYSPAPHVGVILSTEAVFACMFSYFILGEIFTLFMWIGAIFVLVGILLTQGIFTSKEKHVT
jgi:drug/metabolite transporter (DMT)-like permease